MIPASLSVRLRAGLAVLLAGGLSVALAADLRGMPGNLLLASSADERSKAQQAIESKDPVAMFSSMVSVLQHPRCLNCHPTGDYPRQGNDRHPHLFSVARGADDKGLPFGRCTACHGSANNSTTGIPGAPDWHLAPLSMGWEGLSPAQLCQVLLDPARNGKRTPAQIADHVAHDQQFVAWAWTPGRNPAGKEREAPPIPRPEFNRLVEQWVAAGAICPP